ncbi:hypothetical protein V6N13_029906 [Hibiscus sabdariffa]
MAEGEVSRRATHVEGQNVPEVGEEISFVQPPEQPPMQPAEDVPNQLGIPVLNQGDFLQALEMIINWPPRISIAKELKDLRAPDFTDGDPITADYWLNDLKVMLEEAVNRAKGMEKVRAERIATRSAQFQKRCHGGSFGMSSSKRSKGSYQGNWAGSTASYRQRFGPGKSKSSQVSSTRTGNVQKSQGLVSCEHCGKYHFGKCQTITGACYKCGSTDHYIHDCPKAGNRPEISERSAGQSQKGKYFGNQQSVKITRPGTSKVSSNREFRTPAKVYHIRTGEEKDAPDIVTVLS